MNLRGRALCRSSLSHVASRYPTAWSFSRRGPLYPSSSQCFASTAAANMATAFQIHVSPDNTGLCGTRQSDAVATKVSELLQTDMERHHVFFNARGYHNHIPHHLLALYGTGCDAAALDKAYKENASYQITAMDPKPNVLSELDADYATAYFKYAGNNRHYGDFLRFYQTQIEKSGWQAVMTEYLLGDSKASKDMFERLFAGLLHPLIQLMYGVEWEQPAIVAEGLAQAAIHKNNFGAFFAKIDEKANTRTSSSAATAGARRPLVEVCENVRTEQPRLAQSPKFDDDDLFAALTTRFPDESAAFIADSVSVDADNIEEEIDEMVHTCAYIAAAAAFHGSHKPKYDFFIIHHLTSTPFFVWLKSQPWVTNASKARLLELKRRIDAVDYICRGSPALNIDPIRAYVPRDVRSGDRQLVSKPEQLLPRFHATPDDGHTIKTVRSLMLAQELTAKYLDKRPAWLRITDDETWLKMHYALLDAVEGIPSSESRFVRSAGFDEAWENVPKLEKFDGGARL